MNSGPRPVLLSGIKPTGELHIGNYFGAMRQLVDLFKSGEHDCYIMVADYHALNFIQNAQSMHNLSLDLATAYMAVGLDPANLTIFKQSDVPAHTELAWIFESITTMPYLMRAHAFKDAEAKNHEISVGTFNYPLLMAADILLYGTAIVPVGQDQKQHVEYARDTAEKFNRIFSTEAQSDIFKLPEAFIMPEVAIVPGTDGQKMSKSYGNTIPLFASRDIITERVMSIVTDSSADRPENVYAIHRLLKSEDELAHLYEEHKGKYKALKDALIEDLDVFIAPMRERYEKLKRNPDIVRKALHEGATKAQAKAEIKMKEVRKVVGVA
jgi:tryptophanyl-tRNA synthetase